MAGAEKQLQQALQVRCAWFLCIECMLDVCMLLCVCVCVHEHGEYACGILEGILAICMYRSFVCLSVRVYIDRIYIYIYIYIHIRTYITFIFASSDHIRAFKNTEALF